MQEIKIDYKNVRKILVRSVNWIGDAVMTTPAISLLRDFFPQAEIALLANPMVSELFRHDPRIDEIITFHRNGRHKGFTGRIKLGFELRKRSFDLAVIFPNSFDSASAPWLAGIPLRIGKKGDGRTLLLTHSCSRNVLPDDVHQSIVYVKLLNCFGIKGKSFPQSLFITPEEQSSFDSRLFESGISKDDFILCVNPGASYGSAKRWYPDRFARVAEIAAKEFNARIVITGGKGEQNIASDIERGLEHKCLNLAGKTTVRELMALLNRCNMLITNDSGPMHIAAAFNTPTVAVFGSTDSRTTFPLSENAVVVRHDMDCSPCMKRECVKNHECMLSVTVDDVLSAAVELKKRIVQRAVDSE